MAIHHWATLGGGDRLDTIAVELVPGRSPRRARAKERSPVRTIDGRNGLDWLHRQRRVGPPA